jgi:hypothetical protein
LHFADEFMDIMAGMRARYFEAAVVDPGADVQSHWSGSEAGHFTAFSSSKLTKQTFGVQGILLAIGATVLAEPTRTTSSTAWVALPIESRNTA